MPNKFSYCVPACNADLFPFTKMRQPDLSSIDLRHEPLGPIIMPMKLTESVYGILMRYLSNLEFYSRLLMLGNMLGHQ